MSSRKVVTHGCQRSPCASLQSSPYGSQPGCDAYAMQPRHAPNAPGPAMAAQPAARWQSATAGMATQPDTRWHILAVACVPCPWGWWCTRDVDGWCCRMRGQSEGVNQDAAGAAALTLALACFCFKPANSPYGRAGGSRREWRQGGAVGGWPGPLFSGGSTAIDCNRSSMYGQ